MLSGKAHRRFQSFRIEELGKDATSKSVLSVSCYLLALLTLKMDTVRFSETSVNFYGTVGRILHCCITFQLLFETVFAPRYI
jgi:hypothetical protein